MIRPLDNNLMSQLRQNILNQYPHLRGFHWSIRFPSATALLEIINGKDSHVPVGEFEIDGKFVYYMNEDAQTDFPDVYFKLLWRGSAFGRYVISATPNDTFTCSAYVNLPLTLAKLGYEE